MVDELNEPEPPSSDAEEGASPESPAKDASGYPASPDPEPSLFWPVLRGRVLLSIGMLLAIAFTNFPPLNGWMARTFMPAPVKPRTEWKIGAEADLQITLITEDQRRLNCSHNDVIEGYHCDYAKNRRLWPKLTTDPVDDDREKVIQPYRTADTNKLVLVAGLWAQPALAMRLHREPPRVVPERKQIRFVAYCRVKFVGEMKDAALRWKRRGKWHEDQTALVAKPLHCTLEDPNKST